jgi:hypothetical protein
MNRLLFGDNLGWLRDTKQFPAAKTQARPSGAIMDARFFDNLEMMCKAQLDMTALAVVGVTVAIAQLVLQLISLLKKK